MQPELEVVMRLVLAPEKNEIKRVLEVSLSPVSEQSVLAEWGGKKGLAVFQLLAVWDVMTEHKDEKAGGGQKAEIARQRTRHEDATPEFYLLCTRRQYLDMVSRMAEMKTQEDAEQLALYTKARNYRLNQVSCRLDD